jgi:predicted RNA polymerase sigma factor
MSQAMSSAGPEPVAPLVEHFFRHEAGRLMSLLTRFFGWRHFDLVEDMVQATLLDALEAWRVRGVPDALLTLQRSPVYLLNRAVVVAQIEGPRAGIRELDEAGRDPALRHYHLFDATLGELYRCAGDVARTRQHFEAARRKTTSPFDREVLDRRLAQCE